MMTICSLPQNARTTGGERHQHPNAGLRPMASVGFHMDKSWNQMHVINADPVYNWHIVLTECLNTTFSLSRTPCLRINHNVGETAERAHERGGRPGMISISTKPVNVALTYGIYSITNLTTWCERPCGTAGFVSLTYCFSGSLSMERFMTSAGSRICILVEPLFSWTRRSVSLDTAFNPYVSANTFLSSWTRRYRTVLCSPSA